jgi:Xaa-Pro aminopeptidase
MAPPPPPPPMCFPFSRSRKPLPSSELYRAESEKSYHPSTGSHGYELERSGSFSPTATLTSAAADGLTYHTSEYNDPTFNDLSAIPALRNEPRSQMTRSDSKKQKMQEMAEVQRSNTVSSQSKAPVTKQKERWGGYGFGLGAKNKDKEQERDMLQRNGTVSTQTPLPLYQPPSQGPSRQASKSSKSSKASKETYMSSSSGGTRFSASRTNGSRRPGMHSNDSSSTLVGSALDRKINDVESVKERVDTTFRLEEIRKLMQRDKLDY